MLLELTLARAELITSPSPPLCKYNPAKVRGCFVVPGLYSLSPQDLFSALIKGPTRTPYEDGLFLFDIQLPNIYPAVPPLFRYLSQCSGRLNPNLYDNGKVCVSLLGTWIGKVTLSSAHLWGRWLCQAAFGTSHFLPGQEWLLVSGGA